MRARDIAVILSLLVLAVAPPASARDFAIYPVGPPRIVQNLEIAPVYFQPIDLEGALMQSADGADIHLEVDIHAAQDDPGGYAQGDWRPYLNVTYRLTKIATGQTLSGTLMPLVSYGGKAGAAAGKPHYGDNLKLLGPGKYRLDLSIAPPDQAQAGIDAAFAPFSLHYEFVYAGIGKRGAY